MLRAAPLRECFAGWLAKLCMYISQCITWTVSPKLTPQCQGAKLANFSSSEGRVVCMLAL